MGIIGPTRRISSLIVYSALVAVACSDTETSGFAGYGSDGGSGGVPTSGGRSGSGGSGNGGKQAGTGGNGGKQAGTGGSGGKQAGTGGNGGKQAGDGGSGGSTTPVDGGSTDASTPSVDASTSDASNPDVPDGPISTPDGGAPEWIRQFGGPNYDAARAVAVDADGSIYVAGVIGGEQSGGPALNGGSYDAFVRKYNALGFVVWTHQFGTTGDDAADSVAVDGAGNVFVAGSVGAALPGQSALGQWDAFVRGYDSSGNELWTRQFGSDGYETARVAIDGARNVIVSGLTGQGLPGHPDAGPVTAYAYVRKYDASGTELWTRQFQSTADLVGNSANVFGSATVDPEGNVYFAGGIEGTLPGQTNEGGQDAYVRKYDASGNELWTREFGTPEDDGATTIAADSAGSVFVAGRTFGTLPNETSSGVADAFIRKYDANGNAMWTRQFGTATPDAITDVKILSGVAHVVGTTSGTLPAQVHYGSTDAFIRGYAANGDVLYTHQFGTLAIEQNMRLAALPDALYVAGQTIGAFSTPFGGFDAVLLRFRRP